MRWKVLMLLLVSTVYVGAQVCVALYATTDQTADQLRSSLTTQVWSASTLPSRLADTVTANVPVSELDSSIAFVNLSRLDRYTITTHGNTVNDYLFRPAFSSGTLVVLGLGHADVGKLTGLTVTPNLINICLNRGATVLMTVMPYGGTAAHDALGTQTGLNPMVYFLEPNEVALNTYLAQNPAPTQIIATGVSGGGWSTVLLAAIDTRIQKSFPIAGSLPLSLRDANNINDYGDWEQRLYTLGNGVSALDYLDLYLAGVSHGRFQVQVNNQYDTCCFYGTRQTSYAPTLTAVNPRWTFYQEQAPNLHGATDATMTAIVGAAIGPVVSAQIQTYSVLIDDSQTGFTATGPDWYFRTDEGNAYNGNIHHMKSVPSCLYGGTGARSAYWTFTGVPAVPVQVRVTWSAYSNRATNTPFEVTNGQIVLASQLYNQQNWPAGIVVNGKTFQTLGPLVTTTTGTLVVHMSDNANGCVIADAVQVTAQ